MEKIFGLGIVVALMLILSGCITPDNNEIANPASVYCVENGGTLEIITNEEGGQIGICTFANGKECEEWAFYNGECDSKWCPDEGKACTKEYVPVCGKDGKTYGNKCTAESACVEIAYEGECENTQIANPASVYCIENGGILEIREGEEGQYGVCVFGTFECEEWAFFRGECEKPCERWGEPCTLEYMPVCGVDGITYGNRCAAETSCVEVAYEGECEVEKVYCTEEQRGAEVCILLYAPVCGYNANEQMIETFSNSCFACANATVEYWVQGECPI